MKLNEVHRHVQTEGVIENTSFGIIFNAKLVKMLSDGLYSDKILAILRELSANAVDSHRAAGNQSKPFEVHLPSSLNPTFYIRDFGTGLSPEQMKEVYTIYGVSSKEDNNDDIGCLGLGSKTPFCYNTRTANVESWYNGTHYVYSAYLNDKGMPVLSKLSETPSTEPTGLKVSLAVKSFDIQNFSDKARQVYRYFQVKPTIMGSKVDLSPVKYVFTGKDWSLRENSENMHSGACAIMGGICYPIAFSDAHLDANVKDLLTCKVDIFFNIGDLDIEASREGLSYDSKTKGNIVKRCKEILVEIEKLMNDKIATSPSLWDARLEYHKLKNAVSYRIFNLLSVNNLKWNNQTLFPTNSSYYGSQSDVINVTNALTIYSRGYRSKFSKQETSYIPVNENVVFIESDLKKGNLTRLRHYTENNSSAKIVYLNYVDPTHYKDTVDTLGILPSHIIKTSTLTAPTKTSGPRQKRGASTNILKWKGLSLYKTHCWENTQYLLSQGGVYVEVNSFNMIDSAKIEHHPRVIGEMIGSCKQLGLTVPDIYGIKTKMLPKLGSNWTKFEDWITTEIKPLLSKYDSKNVITAAEELRKIQQYDYNNNLLSVFEIKTLENIGKHVDKTTFFTTYIEQIKECEKLSKEEEKCQALDVLIKFLKVKLPATPTKTFSLSTLRKQVHDKYPLMSILNSYTLNGKSAEHLAKYINCIG